MKKQKNKLEVYTHRLDPDKVNAVVGMGVDLNEAFRSLIDKLADTKTCPTCNQKIKKVKK